MPIARVIGATRTLARQRARLLAALTALASAACERPRVADPGAVVRDYAEAAQRGDSRAIYALLSARSQRELGAKGTERLVQDAKKELALEGRFLARRDLHPEAVAVVRFEDGERAELELEDGVFRISSAAALPAGARTPVEALATLRQALARRSYAALVRVLSSDTQSALETDLNEVVTGLEDPETLDVEVEGDQAEVELPSGHIVKLKRESGNWRVEDLR